MYLINKNHKEFKAVEHEIYLLRKETINSSREKIDALPLFVVGSDDSKVLNLVLSPPDIYSYRKKPTENDLIFFYDTLMEYLKV
jgi:hypothetical protein